MNIRWVFFLFFFFHNSNKKISIICVICICMCKLHVYDDVDVRYKKVKLKSASRTLRYEKLVKCDNARCRLLKCFLLYWILWTSVRYRWNWEPLGDDLISSKQPIIKDTTVKLKNILSLLSPVLLEINIRYNNIKGK